jgi:hypothetical protein
MGVEVIKLLPSLSEETFCPQSLSELGLMLTLAECRLGGATPSIFVGIGIADEWVWSGDIMEWVWSGRLRKMDGENVSSLLVDFSLACGDKKPESRVA